MWLLLSKGNLLTSIPEVEDRIVSMYTCLDGSVVAYSPIVRLLVGSRSVDLNPGDLHEDTREFESGL